MSITTAIKTAIQPSAGQGVWDFLNTQMASAQAVVITASVLVGGLIVLGVAYKTKSLVSTILAGVLAAIVVFLVGGGVMFFSNTVKDTTTTPGKSAPVVRMISGDSQAGDVSRG